MKILDSLFGKNAKVVCKKGKCIIAKCDNNMYAVKKNFDNIKKTYEYLESRSFEYFPKIIKSNNEYNAFEYINEVNNPMEQKAFDMVNLLSMLHNKTTFYREMDKDEYKELFENIQNRINEVAYYYINLINMIETKIFMSPSEYLIARNISKILGSLEYSRKTINDWYDIVKNNAKKRVSLIYNNADINHVLRDKELYLINWEKAKIDIPIYDLYKFYKKYALYFNFKELLKYYEDKYPLLDEEKMLFNVLISIPEVITFKEPEIENCKKIKKIIDFIYRTELIVGQMPLSEK